MINFTKVRQKNAIFADQSVKYKTKIIPEMKKIAIAIATLFISAFAMSAQNLGEITEVFNNGAAALSNGEKTEALGFFQKAFESAKALGEEGKAIVENCTKIIPEITTSIAKDLFKSGDIDAAVAKLKESVAFAKENGNADAEAEANTLIGQFLSKKGADALNAKDYAAAAAAYKEVLEADATNGTAALRLGMALAGTGDLEAAAEAYKQAAANGQEAAANKQLGNLSLKAAASALKAKDFKTALAKAVESAEINPSANAYKIAGTAAAQLKQYGDAVNYFTKYLEVAPNAADAAQMKANIEAFKKLAK